MGTRGTVANQDSLGTQDSRGTQVNQGTLASRVEVDIQVILQGLVIQDLVVG